MQAPSYGSHQRPQTMATLKNQNLARHHSTRAPRLFAPATHGLDLQELVEAKASALPTVAGLLEPAKG
jgi:hypothetical protein